MTPSGRIRSVGLELATRAHPVARDEGVGPSGGSACRGLRALRVGARSDVRVGRDRGTGGDETIGHAATLRADDASGERVDQKFELWRDLIHDVRALQLDSYGIAEKLRSWKVA